MTPSQVGCTLFRMIAVYIRISSHSQKTDSQKAEITEWLKRHGHPLKKVVWFEDRESGSSLNRQKFKELQGFIFQGKVKTVVVWKLDRLARNLREGVNVLADWCNRNVRILSITQKIDLGGPVGHLIASLLFGIAEMVRLQHIRERQAAGIRVAKKKGVYAGRKGGTLKANPDRAKTLREKGMTDREIASALGVGKSTVYRYFARTKEILGHSNKDPPQQDYVVFRG